MFPCSYDMEKYHLAKQLMLYCSAEFLLEPSQGKIWVSNVCLGSFLMVSQVSKGSLN